MCNLFHFPPNIVHFVFDMLHTPDLARFDSAMTNSKIRESMIALWKSEYMRTHNRVILEVSPNTRTRIEEWICVKGLRPIHVLFSNEDNPQIKTQTIYMSLIDALNISKETFSSVMASCPKLERLRIVGRFKSIHNPWEIMYACADGSRLDLFTMAPDVVVESNICDWARSVVNCFPNCSNVDIPCTIFKTRILENVMAQFITMISTMKRMSKCRLGMIHFDAVKGSFRILYMRRQYFMEYLFASSFNKQLRYLWESFKINNVKIHIGGFVERTFINNLGSYFECDVKVEVHRTLYTTQYDSHVFTLIFK